MQPFGRYLHAVVFCLFIKLLIKPSSLGGYTQAAVGLPFDLTYRYRLTLVIDAFAPPTLSLISTLRFLWRPVATTKLTIRGSLLSFVALLIRSPSHNVRCRR